MCMNITSYSTRCQLKERENPQTLHQAVHLPAVIRQVIQIVAAHQAIPHLVRLRLAAHHPVAPLIQINNTFKIKSVSNT